MSNNQKGIILITGIMASGKSTVAQLLAERFEKSVHLRGDLYRRMIVNNRMDIKPDPDLEQLEQLRLRIRLAAQSADTYAESGFTVVVQDVIIGKLLHDFIQYVRTQPLYVVVLCPNVETVRQRELARDNIGYTDWTVEALDRVLRDETPRIGLWIDSSDMTPEETVDRIVEQLQLARIRSI